MAHGYGGLYAAIKAHPEGFAHIPQRRRNHTVKQWISIARELARKNGGFLPSTNHLRKAGYSGLVYAMSAHRRVFPKIRQARNHPPEPTIREWHAIAKKLEQARGRLPNQDWLLANGYEGLDQAMKSRPALFRDIQQNDKRWRPLDEWVSIHRQLILTLGHLPGNLWLDTHGHHGLRKAMRKHRRHFYIVKDVA